MKHRLSPFLRGVGAVLAVGVGAVLGADHVAAQIGKLPPESNPLSPYIGDCIGVVTTSEIAGITGVLQSASETHIELGLGVERYPVVALMPHVVFAIVDTDGELLQCDPSQSTGVAELLEKFAPQMRE